ncbi:hypothetical protein NBRC3257_2152 [Gluconobacter thailandicus NBRC 3257]|uniref:Transposase n=1 Tax=Gluconobacter thailandicus NBRC 3257 TaxID=1381097 RepID=A0ABQ0J030_GLUTH|nr:hypothetical protein NBRC3257_2152 [Gluconobacter thailandicus NBRC 3257]
MPVCLGKFRAGRLAIFWQRPLNKSAVSQSSSGLVKSLKDDF